MKIYFTLLISILLSTTGLCQSYKLSWSDEIKLKNLYGLRRIVYGDMNNIYLLEGKFKMTKYFLVGADYKLSGRLKKLDGRFEEVYVNDFSDELKGMDFEDIQMMKNRLYVFAQDYIKKQKEIVMYALEIDKATGQAIGEKIPICNIPVTKDQEAVLFTVQPSFDSTGWVLAADISEKEAKQLYVQTFNADFSKQNTFRVATGFDPEIYDMENIAVVKDRLLVLGKEYVLESAGKKKTKKVFKRMVLQQFSTSGEKTNLRIQTDDKFSASGTMMQLKNGDVFVTGFYSNTPGKTSFNGVYIYKIDAATGDIAQQSFSQPQISNTEEAAEQEFSINKNMLTRDVLFDEKSSNIYIVSEYFEQKNYYTSRSSFDLNNRLSTRTSFNMEFTTNDIFVMVVNSKTGQIGKTYTLPKKQSETSTIPIPRGVFSFSGFSKKDIDAPLFASFTTVLRNDRLIFIYNDNPQNKKAAQLTDAVQPAGNLRESSCFAVSLNMTTGEINRKSIFNNDGSPTCMPRVAYVNGNLVFIPSWGEMKGFSLPPVQIGRLSID